MAGTNYNYELNKGMKVFSQLFVGIQTQSKKEVGVPLGFATPYEDNTQGRKRQETVKSWCGGYDYSSGWAKKIEAMTKIVENTPRSGFKITDDIKRVYWGGGNVVFRVADPYGFELEIQSSNLMALIQVSGITAGGEIPGKCLWGRDGASNILLHEKSDEFKNAIMGAEKLEVIKTLGKESTNIGNEYLLKNGNTGIYLGKYHVVTINSIIDNRGQYITTPVTMKCNNTIKNVSGHTLEFKECGQYDLVLLTDNAIMVYKKAPLVRELKANVYTPKKCLSLSQKVDLMTFAGSSQDGTISLVTEYKPKKLHFGLVPWSKLTFTKRLAQIKQQATQSLRRLSGTQDLLYPRLIQEHYNAPVEVLFNNMICHSGSFSASAFDSYYGQSWNSDSLGVIINNGDTLTVAVPNNHSQSYSSGNKTNVYETFKLPGFSTVEPLLEWCEKQYDDGKLMEFKLIEDRE